MMNLTDKEIEILKAFKTIGLEWIGRNQEGCITAFIMREGKGGERIGAAYYGLDENYFKQLTFFGGPKLIDDLLKECGNAQD